LGPFLCTSTTTSACGGTQGAFIKKLFWEEWNKTKTQIQKKLKVKQKASKPTTHKKIVQIIKWINKYLFFSAFTTITRSQPAIEKRTK
jgi:hypothetical protein